MTATKSTESTQGTKRRRSTPAAGPSEAGEIELANYSTTPLTCADWEIRAFLSGQKTQFIRPAVLDAKSVLPASWRKIGWTMNADFARVGDLGKIISSLVGKEREAVSQQISVPARHPGDPFDGDWEKCGFHRIYCPFGGPGDRVWVREAWAGPFVGAHCKAEYRYRATDADNSIPFRGHWKPATTMKREASRSGLTLKIESVRAMRVSQLKPADIVADGMNFSSDLDFYKSLWRDRFGRKHPWDSDPWCWCVGVKRAE